MHTRYAKIPAVSAPNPRPFGFMVEMHHHCVTVRARMSKVGWKKGSIGVDTMDCDIASYKLERCDDIEDKMKVMLIRLVLWMDFINVNAMDCDIAGCKQGRHDCVTTKMKSMIAKVGWKMDFIGREGREQGGLRS